MTELTVSADIVASVHYTGTLPDNGEVFDSSVEIHVFKSLGFIAETTSDSLT